EDLSEYWAFQSRFSLLNFFDQPVGKSYVDLREKLNQKNYHIITTNADNAFYTEDFDMNKVFIIQCEYVLLQYVNHCHQNNYSYEAFIRLMVTELKDMNIPADLISYCTKCGAGLEVNKRTEEKGMVEDPHFHAQKERYEQFLNENKNKKLL